MKYKNIRSAIHNFGQSFVSAMNYVDDDIVLHELNKIHIKGYDIEIDWLTGHFEPVSMRSSRIDISIARYQGRLPAHLGAHDVEDQHLKRLALIWPASQRRAEMLAIDDRDVEHRIEIRDL